MRRVWGLLAVLLLVSMAAAVPAQGAATVTRIPLEGPAGALGALAGPAFAGDALVWGRAVGGAYQVITQHGSAHETSTIDVPGAADASPPVFSADLAGSESRVGVSLDVVFCHTDECTFDTPQSYRAALLGRPGGGGFAALAGCMNEAACQGPGGTVTCANRPGVDVSDDVVAYTDCQRHLHVRDLAPGASPAGRDYPGQTFAVDVADSLTTVGGVSDPTTVSNWRTGDTLFSAPTFVNVSLQPEGKLAFDDAFATKGGVFWAAPGDTDPKQVTPEAPSRIVMRNDLIAYRTTIFGGGYEGPTLWVRKLDGDLVRKVVDGDQVASFDFDGTRLAWITKPCVDGRLVVWDLKGDSPAPPDGECPFPRVVPGSARVDRGNRLNVKLACPADAALSCEGIAGATGVIYRRYAIDPGVSRLLRLGSYRGFCGDSKGRIRVKLLLTARKRGGYEGQTVTRRRNVVATGRSHSCRLARDDRYAPPKTR